MKLRHVLVMAAIAAASAGHAQTTPASGAGHEAHHPAAAAQSDGEVRKIDKEQGKVTLRHGALENLGMPAMTMVFKVADPKILDNLKAGDKVKFTAEKIDGVFTVTALQVVK